MSTPKHTPGPLHNGQPCTCCILLRTGEPLESIHGNQPCSDISRIELCPLHAAAPAMYEALQLMVHAAQCGLVQAPRNIELARQALAQAEGK